MLLVMCGFYVFNLSCTLAGGIGCLIYFDIGLGIGVREPDSGDNTTWVV